MQDAAVGNWSRESQLSIEHLNSMRDLNRRFLELAGAAGGEDRGNGANLAGLAGQIAVLSVPQRAAAANCPYALFDLRFADEAHWRCRLAGATASRVADEPSLDHGTVDFVRLALFYAWHVAASSTLGAHLLLGMRGTTAAAFRRMTVDGLPALAATEAPNLTARWSACQGYWSALLGAAAREDFNALRRVQLSGLQLAAADELPDA